MNYSNETFRCFSFADVCHIIRLPKTFSHLLFMFSPFCRILKMIIIFNDRKCARVENGMLAKRNSVSYTKQLNQISRILFNACKRWLLMVEKLIVTFRSCAKTRKSWFKRATILCASAFESNSYSCQWFICYFSGSIFVAANKSFVRSHNLQILNSI